jgi:hypothetical protein
MDDIKTTAAPGSGARLDDEAIWRLKTVEHLTTDQIMERVGCSRGGHCHVLTMSPEEAREMAAQLKDAAESAEAEAEMDAES